MAESRIEVDLLNPGQVFACLGLMEATETLLGDAGAIFEWKDGEMAATFRIWAAGDEKPTERVTRFLEEGGNCHARTSGFNQCHPMVGKLGRQASDRSTQHAIPLPRSRLSGHASHRTSRQLRSRSSH